MFMFPIDHHKQTARQEFTDLYRMGKLNTLWSMVSGRQSHLMHLDAVRKNGRIRSRSDAGMQIVPIDAIAGSESRPDDFDRNWRPLKSSNDERWINISVARIKDVPLPAIDLVKVGETYFVRDGHHRISVAKHSGQVEMEANVTEWALAPAEGAATTSPSALGEYYNKIQRSLVWEKETNGIQQTMARLSTLQRDLMGRTTRIFSRPQNPFKSGTAA